MQTYSKMLGMTFKEEIILPNMRNGNGNGNKTPKYKQFYFKWHLYIKQCVYKFLLYALRVKEKRMFSTFMLIATRNSTLMNNGYNIDAVRNGAT